MTGKDLDAVVAAVHRAAGTYIHGTDSRTTVDPRSDDDCIAVAGELLMALRAQRLDIYAQRKRRP